MTEAFDVANKIQLIDKHFQELYRDIGSYLKLIEKMRVKSERLGTHLKEYAAVETPGLKATLQGLSECIHQVEDRRKEMYDRLQIKVYEVFINYETHCRDAKEMLKKKTAADQMQNKKTMELSAINARNKTDLAKVSAARNALSKATQDSKSARDAFYTHLETFEKQKIRDLKEVWGDYIHSHILYHSKCLEIMTRAHSLINSVDEDEEMETVLRVTRARQNDDDPLGSLSPDAGSTSPLSSRRDVSVPPSPTTNSLGRSTSNIARAITPNNNSIRTSNSSLNSSTLSNSGNMGMRRGPQNNSNIHSSSQQQRSSNYDDDDDDFDDD
jgi:predicted  nucleic acid-binding Zn-ribbon protein